MYINTFKYRPEDVDCKLCTEYSKKTGCTAGGCPYLAERMEAGVVGYGEAVMETFSHCRPIHPRLAQLIRHFPGSLWEDEAHRRRMDWQRAVLGCRPKRDTPQFFAAMYLITATEPLYARAANCLCKSGVDFRYARLPDISMPDFALLAAARSICGESRSVSMADMADREAIGDDAFRPIINALLIARYGTDALKLSSGAQDGRR